MLITLNRVTYFSLFYVYLLIIIILADEEESLKSETFAGTANEGSGKGTFIYIMMVHKMVSYIIMYI